MLQIQPANADRAPPAAEDGTPSPASPGSVAEDALSTTLRKAMEDEESSAYHLSKTENRAGFKARRRCVYTFRLQNPSCNMRGKDFNVANGATTS